MPRSVGVLTLLWLPLQPVLAQRYQLIQNYNASNFFDSFNFFTGPDPTGGFVDYVPFDKATSTGLARNVSDVVYLGVDSTNAYKSGGPGRPSVRLESKMTFTEGLFVIDLTHMPVGCGTWPAFWTTGLNDWPNDGEIDIIENVNDARNNNGALHAAGECTVAQSTFQRGTVVNTDCNIGHNDNQGCGTAFTEPNNYGTGFNTNGGGIYAMQWNSTSINIWFFTHGDAPGSLTTKDAGVSPDPATFGTPSASFAGPCSGAFPEKFFNHSIVIDTTFCGGWAGGTFGTGDSKCPVTPGSTPLQSCVDYVANNPTAFKDAWWGIKNLKVWAKVPGFTTNGSNQKPAITTTVKVALPSAQGTLGSLGISPLTGGTLNVGNEDIISKPSLSTVTKRVRSSSRSALSSTTRTSSSTTTKKAGPTPANAAPTNKNTLPLLLPVSSSSSSVVTSIQKPSVQSTSIIYHGPTPKPWYVNLDGPINEDGLIDDLPDTTPALNSPDLISSSILADYTAFLDAASSTSSPAWHDWTKNPLPTDSDVGGKASPVGSENYKPITVEDYFPGRGPMVSGSSKPLSWATFDSNSNPLSDSSGNGQFTDIPSELRVPGASSLPENPKDWTPGPVLPDFNSLDPGVWNTEDLPPNPVDWTPGSVVSNLENFPTVTPDIVSSVEDLPGLEELPPSLSVLTPLSSGSVDPGLPLTLTLTIPTTPGGGEDFPPALSSPLPSTTASSVVNSGKPAPNGNTGVVPPRLNNLGPGSARQLDPASTIQTLGGDSSDPSDDEGFMLPGMAVSNPNVPALEPSFAMPSGVMEITLPAFSAPDAVDPKEADIPSAGDGPSGGMPLGASWGASVPYLQSPELPSVFSDPNYVAVPSSTPSAVDVDPLQTVGFATDYLPVSPPAMANDGPESPFTGVQIPKTLPLYLGSDSPSVDSYDLIDPALPAASSVTGDLSDPLNFVFSIVDNGQSPDLNPAPYGNDALIAPSPSLDLDSVDNVLSLPPFVGYSSPPLIATALPTKKPGSGHELPLGDDALVNSNLGRVPDTPLDLSPSSLSDIIDMLMSTPDDAKDAPSSEPAVLINLVTPGGVGGSMIPSTSGNSDSGLKSMILNNPFKINARQLSPIGSDDDTSEDDESAFIEQQLYSICPSMNTDTNPIKQLVVSLKDPNTSFTKALNAFQNSLSAFMSALNTCALKVGSYALKLKQVEDANPDGKIVRRQSDDETVHAWNEEPESYYTTTEASDYSVPVYAVALPDIDRILNSLPQSLLEKLAANLNSDNLRSLAGTDFSVDQKKKLDVIIQRFRQNLVNIIPSRQEIKDFLLGNSVASATTPLPSIIKGTKDVIVSDVPSSLAGLSLPYPSFSSPPLPSPILDPNYVSNGEDANQNFPPALSLTVPSKLGGLVGPGNPAPNGNTGIVPPQLYNPGSGTSPPAFAPEDTPVEPESPSFWKRQTSDKVLDAYVEHKNDAQLAKWRYGVLNKAQRDDLHSHIVENEQASPSTSSLPEACTVPTVPAASEPVGPAPTSSPKDTQELSSLNEKINALTEMFKKFLANPQPASLFPPGAPIRRRHARAFDTTEGPESQEHQALNRIQRFATMPMLQSNAPLECPSIPFSPSSSSHIPRPVGVTSNRPGTDFAIPGPPNPVSSSPSSSSSFDAIPETSESNILPELKSLPVLDPFGQMNPQSFPAPSSFSSSPSPSSLLTSPSSVSPSPSPSSSSTTLSTLKALPTLDPFGQLYPDIPDNLGERVGPNKQSMFEELPTTSESDTVDGIEELKPLDPFGMLDQGQRQGKAEVDANGIPIHADENAGDVAS